MGKQGKKKGGKKDQPSEATVTSVTEPPPSTSATSAPPEEEEDVGLTGPSRKKKDKKEKKEKALQALEALKASRKQTTSESTPIDVSEPPSAQESRAQSEAPSEKSTEDKPEEVQASKQTTESKTEQLEEEFEGLGLGKSRAKRPKKKKADVAQTVQQAGQPQAPTPETVAGQPPRGPGPTQGPSAAPPRGPVPTPSSWGASPGFPIQTPSAAPIRGPAPTPAPLAAPIRGPVPTQAPLAGPPGFPVQRGPVPTPYQQTAPPRGPVPTQPAPVQAPPSSWSRPGSKPPSKEATPSPASSTSSLPRSVPPTPIPSEIPPKVQVAQPTPTVGAPAKYVQPVMGRYRIPAKIRGNTVPAQRVQVLVNYLEMQFQPIQVYRYDVAFAPDRPKKMLPQIFKLVQTKYFPKELLAFDQMKNCYSLRKLQGIESDDRWAVNETIKDRNGKAMNFKVSLKATGIVNLQNIKQYMESRRTSLQHPTEEVQCIDVILRQGALESYIKAGRQFFKRPERPVDLGYGYEMWTGLFQSAIFTNKSFINIDVAHKGFPKAKPLINIIQEDFNMDLNRRLENQRGYDYFLNYIKGLKVVSSKSNDLSACAVHKREFICNAVASPPGEITFELKNEKTNTTRNITVLEYFHKVKAQPLKYPKLNCLWVGPKDRNIYFPIEVLEIGFGQEDIGKQALTKQLNEMQVSKMVREAATPPDVRLNKIKEVIASMKYSENTTFKQFGLNISNKFYEVQAKVLKPPTLDCGRDKIIPRRGQWQAQRLLKPEALESWGLIALDTDPRNDYGDLINLVINTGKQMGMVVSQPKFVKVDAKMQSLYNLLINARSEVKFLFVIMSARSRDDYHKVKQMAEREVGILTQCIKEQTARRMNPMTAKNILLKVNSKLMGINQAIERNTMPKCLRGGGVMIVGADVTHPSPDQTNVPSIAAVTASMDDTCYTFNIELSVQTPKKEMIVEFEDMMFDHLRVYKERNSTIPRKIFVFRDGVSEGQFAQVMDSELAAVHKAYERLAGPNKRPEVLFLLVQKRHHTRLFSDSGRSSYNVEPGTVVDTDIVHASELDFYLVSHQAIKGTARPTRYHAVCNDGNIPDDEVEQLTFYLCHLYSRCMRSVSYPTPTYYAHLACLRARSLTYGEKFNNLDLEKQPKRLRVLDKMLQFSRMFFV